MTTTVTNDITPSWLTAVLREAGLLTNGEVLEVHTQSFGAFNSYTQRLQVRYSADAPPALPTHLVLKRNIPEAWAVEAGAEEVRFYQLVAALQPPPPGIIPCYASAYDAASGNSYLLFQDLSETHAPPITRAQQLSIVQSVPAASAIDQIVDALADQHAYWWNHRLLHSDTFPVGYWSRTAEQFARYRQRRETSWDNVRTREASWLPADVCTLYDQVLLHLHQHWERYLAPRFQTQTNLTLVHGDTFFTNFLCPKQNDGGPTYLLDWQGPAFDIGGYDLANLCATFWTSEQRHEAQRERHILERYYARLQMAGVAQYTWDDLVTDYQAGIIYWVLVPVQDAHDGAEKAYWWTEMQCVVAAFRDWQCAALLRLPTA